MHIRVHNIIKIGTHFEMKFQVVRFISLRLAKASLRYWIIKDDFFPAY